MPFPQWPVPSSCGRAGLCGRAPGGLGRGKAAHQEPKTAGSPHPAPAGPRRSAGGPGGPGTAEAERAA